MLKDAATKHYLLSEAKSHREKQRYRFIKSFLIHDAENNVKIKEAMARQSGGSTLKNSGWNTQWSFADPSKRIGAIEAEVEEIFQSLFQSIQSGVVPNEEIAISIIPPQVQEKVRPGSIYFRFGYVRSMLPVNNKESLDKAKNAIDVLDVYLPGFREFQKDLDNRSNSIPLQSYFHVSRFSKEQGSVSPGNLAHFFSSEKQRFTTQGMKLPDGRELPTGSFYNKHINNNDIEQTEYRPLMRIFSNKDINNVRGKMNLVRAIEDKWKAGYRINESSLRKEILQTLHAKIKSQGLDRYSTDPNSQRKIQLLYKHFVNIQNNLTNIPKTWRDDFSAFELRLVLKHLTNGISTVMEPNEFRVPDMSSVYYANGWDSSYRDPQRAMLTIPPIRELPRGDEVVYDRGNGNLGYDHLILSWKNGLDQILEKWGDSCDEWLRTLQHGTFMREAGNVSEELLEAWKNVISLNTGNRTSAEALVDILQKFPDWKSFNDNHLQKSLYSEISSVHKLNKEQHSKIPTFRPGSDLLNQVHEYAQRIQEIGQSDPERASQYLRILSADLSQMYMSGQIEWDELTLALSSINKVSKTNTRIRGNGISSLRPSEKQSMIDEQGFEILKRYGYQVAKMMDFLHAIIIRSCKEVVNTRKDRRQETFYGHQYSTSSGKSGGGEIILSAEYKFKPPTIVQKSNINVVRIEENVNYSLGQRSGSIEYPIILRSSSSWRHMIDVLTENYPEIEFQVGTVFNAMDNNLQRLESACKRGILRVKGSVPVIYINNEGNVTELTINNMNEEIMDRGDDSNIESDQLENVDSDDIQPTKVELNENLQTSPWQQQYTSIDMPAPELAEISDTLIPGPFADQPAEEKSPKPMPEMSIPTGIPMNIPQDYVRKRRNKDRRLTKSRRVFGSFGSVEERLLKAANRLDQKGEIAIADKIDILLSKMRENSNV